MKNTAPSLRIGAAGAAVPPRARALPLIGSLPSLIRDPIAFVEEARATHGDVYRVDLGVLEAILLNHPRHAQHVLRDHAANYTKGGPLWDSIRTLLGDSLPVSEGEHWRRQRRMMQPQFHHERLAAMADLMVQAIDEELGTWGAAAVSGQPFDMFRGLASMAMKVIVRTMFGTSIGRDESDTVDEAMSYMNDFMFRNIVLKALPRWAPVPGRRRHQAAIAAVDAILFRVIARSREEEGRARGSMIDMLLDLVDAETGARMTPTELRDEAVAMFLAGYETTAAALAFAMGYVAEDAGVALALHAEVDAALLDRAPRLADLRRMPRVLRTLQESMRLSPPAYWLPRVAVADDVIDGFAIPAGTMVAPVIYTIHRHPAEWPDAARFDPDRFLPARSAGRHGLAWMPFGAGPRQCIAKEFALMEGQLILARIAQRFEVHGVAGRAPRARLSTALRPRDGVMVRLRRRGRGWPTAPRVAQSNGDCNACHTDAGLNGAPDRVVLPD
jgi:cytochrome P450